MATSSKSRAKKPKSKSKVNEAGNYTKPALRKRPVMYPHSVNEVTKGTRQNIIGWFSSSVSFEHSYMLKQANDIVQMSKSLVKEDAKEINKNLLIKSVLLQKYIRREWSK